MVLMSVGNTITWVVSVMICAYVAQKKGKNTRLALFLGLFFGIFSMVYYLFCKPKKGKWKKKNSWLILAGYILFIIIVVLIELLMRYETIIA